MLLLYRFSNTCHCCPLQIDVLVLLCTGLLLWGRLEESKIVFSENQYHFLKDSVIYRSSDTQLTKEIIVKDEAWKSTNP